MISFAVICPTSLFSCFYREQNIAVVYKRVIAIIIITSYLDKKSFKRLQSSNLVLVS